jgi:DivIVA domain-containing protein
MALSPDDIVNYDFKQAMRGYAIAEVDDLLDRIADQVERSQQDIDDLRTRLRDTEARLAAALETESTLKRTFVTAQQAAERALDDAREQADELRGAAEREVTEQLERANEEAERLVTTARAMVDEKLHSAREQHSTLVRELEELSQLASRQRAAHRALLVDQLAQLDAGAPASGPAAVATPATSEPETFGAGETVPTLPPGWGDGRA